MVLHSPSASESEPGNFFQRLWPCLKGEDIAQYGEIQPIRQELKSLISAPARVYAALYETTLFRFMEFCQIMPQDMTAPTPYSLLTTALETAIAALKIRRGVMLPRHSNSETIAEQEPLWTYAVFTASLWAQLPDLQADRTIVLYKKNEQEKIGHWHPIAGNLYEAQTFYQILPEPHSIIIDSTACLVGSLARITPAVAYRWLTSDHKVWTDWWEVVTQSVSSNNELWPIIQKLLPQNTQNKEVTELNQNATVNSPEIISPGSSENAQDELEAHPEQPSSISEMLLPLTPSTEEENALADVQEWVLHHCSAAGKLNGKKQFVRLSSGLLIRESSLQLFIKENSEYPTVDFILRCLARYLEQASQNPLIQYSFFHDGQEEMMSGIVLKRQHLCDPLKNYPENEFVENCCVKT